MDIQFLPSTGIGPQLARLGQRLTTLGFAFLAMLMLSACESSMIIVNNLDERDANEIIVFLAGHHIDGEKAANEAGKGGGNALPTWCIAVRKSDRMRALTLLNNNGLPRRAGQNLLDLFEKQGLVSSEMEERIRYQSGLAAQIAGTIRKIDGVLDADVQVSFPQDDSIQGQGKAPEPVTASVYVKHQGVLDNPNSHLVLKIKRLVASAIPGLDFDRVTVISDRAVFNDPMSRALTKEPDIVSVWGIRLVQDYVFRLQMLLFGLVSLSFILLVTVGWLFWKVSHVISTFGGFGSLFKARAWEIPAPAVPEPAAAGEAGVGEVESAPSETPPPTDKV